MKKKKCLIIILMALISHLSHGQMSMQDVRYSRVRDSLKVGSNTIVGFDKDTTMTANSDLVLPTQKAVANYIGHHLSSSIYFPLTGGTLTATDGSGFMGFHPQVVAVSPPYDGFVLYDSIGLRILGHDGYRRGLHWTGITHNTDYYYPVTIISDTLLTVTSPNVLTNKSINGNNNTISNIGNSSLTNSSLTVQGNSVSLGGSVNPINGTGFVKATGTSLSYDNSIYLTTTGAASTYHPLITGSSTPLRYWTGYENWGSFNDSARAVINATSPLSYNQATGNISHGSSAAYKVLWNNSGITTFPSYNFIDTPAFGGLFNSRVQSSLTANGLSASLYYNYLASGYVLSVNASSVTNTTGSALTIQGGAANGVNAGGALNIYGGVGGSSGPGIITIGASTGTGTAVKIQGGTDITYTGPVTGTILTLDGSKFAFGYDNSGSPTLLKITYSASSQAQYVSAASYYFDNFTLIGTSSNNGVDKLQVSGNINLITAGNKIKIAAATSNTATTYASGLATLSSGTAIITTTAITANSYVIISGQSCSSCGWTYVSAKIAGTSFTLTSTNGSDASTIYWEIRN